MQENYSSRRNSRSRALIILFLFSNLYSCILHANEGEDSGLVKEIFQNPQDYYNDKHIDYTDRIYDKDIKTVLIHTTASELEDPVVLLNDSKNLVLRFDDLSEDVREFSYTFEHCTHDWQKSDLDEMDYMRGFYTSVIYNYEYSFNTLTNYTHYEIEFPNNNIELTRSGNYIVKVYVNNDPADVVLVRRFMVYENGSVITAQVRPSSVVMERDERQEVDVEVNLTDVSTSNPYSDIEIKVLQNFRWDNAKGGLKPSFVKDNRLVYNYQGELTFDGGNEFRFFDGKSLRYRSEQVADITLVNGKYHVYLTPDQPRSYTRYSFVNDINGRLLVKNDDMNDTHLESDYVWVHFFLATPSNIGTDNLFVFGQLSGKGFYSDLQLKYQPEMGGYSCTALLKQGYYNYAYVFRNRRNEGDLTVIEGNHFETENDYTVLVYFKDPQSFADRLIGVRTVNTINN